MWRSVGRICPGPLPDCHYEFLLSFSCRGRWFCPSCHAKKVVQFGVHLRENILFPVPHRHYVFSLPLIIRSPFSTVKMTYNEQMGTVIYRSKMTYGRNRRNFEFFSAVDFIAAITQHIPEKNFQLVRYYGWYSNRMRGDRRKRDSFTP